MMITAPPPGWRCATIAGATSACTCTLSELVVLLGFCCRSQAPSKPLFQHNTTATRHAHLSTRKVAGYQTARARAKKLSEEVRCHVSVSERRRSWASGSTLAQCMHSIMRDRAKHRPKLLPFGESQLPLKEQGRTHTSTQPQRP
jgi:hypothetical protein